MISALAELVANSIYLGLAQRPTDTVGPFLVLLDPTSDLIWRNYAVPVARATPSAVEVADLVEHFTSRARMPRLEYVPSVAPAVEAVLLAAGFVVEGRPPLMACRAGDLRGSTSVGGFSIEVVASAGDLLDVAWVQSVAYDAPSEAGPDGAARLRRLIDGGGTVVLARDASGEAVGGGLVTAARAGVSEIAAIGVVPAYRRRGIASAVTTMLAARAHGAGAHIAWLEPAGEREAAMYEAIGFRADGEKLWISRPVVSS